MRRGLKLAEYQPKLAEIGAVFGVSGRWIGELRAQGVMPADGATLAENVAAFVTYRIGKRG